MKKDLAELVFIVDRSGSMSSIASDMEGAIKSVLKEQKEAKEKELLVTFVRFDTEYEKLFSSAPIDTVDDIEISPRGATALLDAMGKTINSFERKFSETDEKERPEKVLFIIITDGEENSSCEYSKNQVFEIIEKAERDHDWNFTFIGANQDSIQEAGSLGIRSGNTMNFAPSSKGIRGMGNSLSCYATSYFADEKATYSDEDRDASMEE